MSSISPQPVSGTRLPIVAWIGGGLLISLLAGMAGGATAWWLANRGNNPSLAATSTTSATKMPVWGSTPETTAAGTTSVAGPPQLLLHYSFDQLEGSQVPDQSGANRHGKVGGKPKLTPAGVSGTALKLDKQGVRTPKLDLSGGFTVSLFGKFAEPDKKSLQMLFSNHPGGDAPNGLRFYVNNWQRNDRIIAARTGNGKRQTETVATPVGTFPHDKQFHHVALVADYQANHCQLYLDGKLVQEGKWHPESNAHSEFWIGSHENNTVWLGELDEVRLYSGQLTAEAVAVLAKGDSLEP